MMTMTNELTNNYREYWRLHSIGRKTDNLIPDPEIMESINACWERLTDFEKEYANWVNQLYANKINTDEIKRQIKILAKFLGNDGVLGDLPKEDLDSCKPGKAHRWWNKEKRYTQLCALRAAMRGRLHFSPSSNLPQLYGCLRIPCYTGPESYKKIDLAVQREWIEDLSKEFFRK